MRLRQRDDAGGAARASAQAALAAGRLEDATAVVDSIREELRDHLGLPEVAKALSAVHLAAAVRLHAGPSTHKPFWKASRWAALSRASPPHPPLPPNASLAGG